MRVLRWDDGTRWNDVNARWGSPSYVLEPEDPGYVPPSTPPPPPPGTVSSKPTKHKHMSSNATPKSRPVLLSLAHRVHAGQVTHGAAVGLHHHTAPVMDACIKKQEGDPAAAPGSPERLGSQQIYRGSITATTEAEAALAALSEGPVKKWLEEYQGLISSLHGSKPNVHWEEAGWPSGTTAMPTKHPERSDLFLGMKSMCFCPF